MTMVATHPKQTSLFALHRAAGARMIEFGGWEMPVQYTGIVEEHRSVRTAAGLFDVSHMGEIEITGPGALESLQRLIPNDASRLAVGQGLYSPMCTPTGGIIDDLTVFRLGEQRFFFVVNAARAEVDFKWIAEHTRNAVATNRSADLALLALQGPMAAEILQALTRADLSALAYFHAADGVTVASRRCLVSRTGYTGEDGFEIACAWDDAPTLWTAMLETGRCQSAWAPGIPCGWKRAICCTAMTSTRRRRLWKRRWPGRSRSRRAILSGATRFSPRKPLSWTGSSRYLR